MNNKLLFLIFIMLLSGMIVLLVNKFPNILQNKQNYFNIIMAISMLIFLIMGVFRRNINWVFLLKTSTCWLGIVLVLISGYSYQYEISMVYKRILGNIIPSLAQNNHDGTITLYVGQDGHFMANAKVNGATVQFLVDTGASFVLLTPADASRAGFDINRLTYSSAVQTANGTTSTALITISQIQIGNILIKNVLGGVSREGDLDTSLLGMSFLTKLSNYNVSHGMLTMSY